MIYISKAPLRIGLAGGGTDVSPYSDMFGGAILNATINLFASAAIIPRDDDTIIIHARDQKIRKEFKAEKELELVDGLQLQIGIYNRIVKDFLKEPRGFELITGIDSPTGSGLGTSSTLVVAILGAFAEWLRLPLGEYEIAQLAYSIEREDLAMAGGKQDQYAATFGGVNFMEFHKDNNVIINPLRVKDEILQELEFHLLLFYTHISRKSSNIIEEQRENFTKQQADAVAATDKLKEQAYMMKEALLKGDIASIGKILDFGWQNKKQLAKGITNPVIDEIYETATAAGASGGKISGAGGGGYMIFYCPGSTRFQVISALEEKGAMLQRYSFLEKGLTTWTSHQ
ncbi:MAG: dehydrogenase [Bacteroidetes bacterium]|nr:dehydrogenase [Bacteroidota bacterium]